MIIDGDLVVAKKKKIALVQELKKLGFKAFPKVSDAKEAGEVQDAAEDEDDAEQEVGSGDYDYLLGVSSSMFYRYRKADPCTDGDLVFDARES
jgi:DNA topoisomerase II